MTKSTKALGPRERSQLFEAQTSVLEESTRGSELSDVLRVLCLEVEALLDADAKCSVLLVEDGCVHHGAAPSLPQPYIEAIDGAPIGPAAGSCGTAAFTGERVIVEDIGTDPLWADYRHIAEPHELVACWSTPVFNGDGEVIATFAIYPPTKTSPSDYEIAVLDAFSNITGIVIERARVQSQLAAEKRRLASIVRGTDAGAWEWNPSDDTAEVTEDWARILGYSVDELKPISFERVSELAHPDDVALVRAAMEQHFRGETEFFESEFRMRHKSGHWIWLLDRGRVVERDEDGSPILVAGMHMDITERKRREQALRENEQDLKLTLDSIADAVIATDSDHCITRMNAMAEKLTGWSSDEAMNRPIDEVLPFLSDADLQENPAGEDSHLLIEERTFQLEQPDGSTSIVSCSVNVFPTLEGKERRLVATFRDISEHYRVQTELRRNKEVLDRTSRIGRIGGWAMDAETREIWLSEQAGRILGLPEEDRLDLNLGLAIIKEGTERVKRALQRTLSQGEPYRVEFLIETPNGEPKWIRSTGMPEMVGGKCVRVHGAVQDVTEQKQTEQHLQRMQKLESLGRLAGGIAHDFNNILMGFFASVGFAMDELEDDHSAMPDLREAQRALDRARRLTGQLLTFAKGGAPVKEQVSMENLVERVVRFDLSGSDIRPVFNIADDLWAVEADQGQLQQVFSNLTVNAREAMKESGELHISMSNCVLDATNPQQLPAGRYVCAEVRDEGPGIAPELLDQLFDPYFSSKEQGRGLGLATVYSVVNQHGGHIGVKSTDHGAQFSLVLPASGRSPDADSSEESSSSESNEQEHAETARILVLDDDPSVREACKRMLEKMGHSVTCVEDGAAALEQYRAADEHGETFDLAIMDLTVPGGMGGRETLQHLLEDHPGARVIASTGYTDDPILANFAQYGFVGIAPKPYTHEELREIVQGALAGDPKNNRA